jgi:hypothetical protein
MQQYTTTTTSDDDDDDDEDENEGEERKKAFIAIDKLFNPFNPSVSRCVRAGGWERKKAPTAHTYKRRQCAHTPAAAAAASTTHMSLFYTSANKSAHQREQARVGIYD